MATVALLPEPTRRGRAPFPTRIAGPVLCGWLIVSLCFGGFALWSALVPVSSAAIASGTVVVDGSRKSIQHLEGGIVRRILVRDGDFVEVGQPVLQLDDSVQRDARDLLQARLDSDRAYEARLMAERDRQQSISFPDDLEARAREHEKVRAMIAGQVGIFEARRASLAGQVAILQNRIAQSNVEIDGLKVQRQSKQKQAELLSHELDGQKILFGKGYAPENKVLAVERDLAEANGAAGEMTARIATVGQAIGEAQLQIAQLDKAFLEAVESELRQVQTEILDFSQRLASANEEVRRLTVVAPVSGVVVDLAIHTVGGVIPPGGRILDLVPRGDALVVEAQVRPVDVDELEVGSPADIRFSAFKRSTTPVIHGSIAMLSADRLVDPKTNAPYYLVRATVPDEERRKLAGLRLVPGMPAEVILHKGSHTLLGYLSGPLGDAVMRAFRD
jgi:HlyD family secretion protein/epimerase transport system membrane fusion protein